MRNIWYVATLMLLAGCANARSSTVSVCELISNKAAFDGRNVTVSAELAIEPHGGHLFDESCAGAGALRLVIESKVRNDQKVVAMIRSVMANHAKGHVVLTGVFRAKPIDTDVGTLILGAVL